MLRARPHLYPSAVGPGSALLPGSRRCHGRGARALPIAALLIGLMAALGACSLQPTPYQPLADAGGYEETRLQKDVFRVSFRGNRATPETTVLDFLFLRCAELTRTHGYTHFVIQEDFGRTQLDLRATPRSSVGVGMGFGSRSSFWALGFGTPVADSYEASVSYHLAVFVIRLLDEEEARSLRQGPQAPRVYEAAYLLESLEPKRRASQPEDG